MVALLVSPKRRMPAPELRWRLAPAGEIDLVGSYDFAGAFDAWLELPQPRGGSSSGRMASPHNCA